MKRSAYSAIEIPCVYEREIGHALHVFLKHALNRLWRRQGPAAVQTIPSHRNPGRDRWEQEGTESADGGGHEAA